MLKFPKILIKAPSYYLLKKGCLLQQRHQEIHVLISRKYFFFYFLILYIPTAVFPPSTYLCPPVSTSPFSYFPSLPNLFLLSFPFKKSRPRNIMYHGTESYKIWAMMAHTINPSTQESEVCRSLSMWEAWSTE